MSWRRNCVLFVMVALVFTSGCITSNGISLAEIRNNFLQKFDSLTSYSFLENYTITQATINESGTATKSYPIEIYGIVDLLKNKYYYRMNGSYESQSGIMSVVYENYIVDGVLYRKMEVLNISEWGKANASLGDYQIFNDIKFQVALMNVSNVSRLADNFVGNVDCYVLKTDVDVKKYYEDSMKGNPFKNNDFVSKFVNITKEWTVTFWIAKDTYQLQKMYQKNVLEYEESSSIQTEEKETHFSGHNSNIYIELPAEAMNANWTTFG